MSTVPPKRQRILQRQEEILAREAHKLPVLTPIERNVAVWLAGNNAALDSLVELLRDRIEGRGALPVPSTPHQVVVEAGRDSEARQIIDELRRLYATPVGSLEQE